MNAPLTCAIPVTEMETPCPELTLTLLTCRVIVFRASLGTTRISKNSF